MSQGNGKVRAVAKGSGNLCPPIIEAARALYARHSVDAISRSDADAVNLRDTSRCVEEILQRAKTQRQKAIVFVTGVPGAGKTLVGLNIATQHLGADDTHGTPIMLKAQAEGLTPEELIASVNADHQRDLAARGDQRVAG